MEEVLRVKFPLKTQRLDIQPLGLNDLEAFVSYRQDPNIARFQSWDTNYTLQQGKDLIDSQQGLTFPEPGDWLQLAIHLSATGELVGDLALHQLEEPKCFELGFTIATKHQRQGFAKEAASKLIEELFRANAAKSFTSFTDRRNSSSISLLLALGFKGQPARSWQEEFKGQTVTVDCYMLSI